MARKKESENENLEKLLYLQRLEAVNKGDTVVILESMKMELEVKATVAGKIHFVAATGSQVSNGQTLAEIN